MPVDRESENGQVSRKRDPESSSATPGRVSSERIARLRLLGVGFTALLFLLVVAAFAGFLPKWIGWTSLIAEGFFVPYFIRKIRALCRC